MSTRIRFSTAADVFAAFPQLEFIVARPSADAPPLDYAQALGASPRPLDGLAFLAHLLPRREAIWWGCQCVSAILGPTANDEGLSLALRWERDPEETTRREALSFSQASALRTPTSWLARAVGYSGGSIVAPDQPVTPPPPEACAQAVNAAAVLAATAEPAPAVLPWMRAFVEAGIRFAAGQEARVAPPVNR